MEDYPDRSQTTDSWSTTAPTAGEMLLIINDIHSLALGSHITREYEAIMREIERLADEVLERSCNAGAHDTSFVVED